MIKLTEKRKKVLDKVKKAAYPISAEQIYESLKDGTMNLSTVYRSLEKLFDEGLVGRNYSNNIAYYYVDAHDHHHFMICHACGKKFEVDCHIDEMIEDIYEKYGFKVSHHDLNFTGLCKDCQ